MVFMTATIASVAQAARALASRPTEAALMAALATHPPPASDLGEIAARIGPRATLALIEAEGGRRVFVPHRPNQATPLARAIGLPAAQALAKAGGGVWLRVPLARAWRVRLYRHCGATYRDIAGWLGITESQVSKLLRDAGLTARPTQLELFGAR